MYQTRRQVLKDNVNIVLQNDKINQSNFCKENTVINKAENCIKSRQKEKNKAKKSQALVTKKIFTDNFKSVNEVENSVIKTSLIYNKCLKKGPKVHGKKSKRTIVDVYDISADDDLRKEELDLKKSKNLKPKDEKKQNKHVIKTRRNVYKSTKLAAKDQDIIQKFKNKAEIQCHPLIPKKPNELNIKELNHIDDIPKSKQLIKEFCLEVNIKNKDSSKLVLRETTPVRELDFNTLNEDSLNSDSKRLSDLVLLTSTPQNAEYPCPTFTTPEFSFAARLSVLPLSSEDVENCPEELSNEENILATASNHYSLVLFGSPEKDNEKINSKNLEKFDAADDERKNKKKEIKQMSTKWKKPDPIVEKKSNAEKKDEEEVEAFYRSFNDQLSELENYELCIE